MSKISEQGFVPTFIKGADTKPIAKSFLGGTSRLDVTGHFAEGAPRGSSIEALIGNTKDQVITHTVGENSGSEVESGSEGCEGAMQAPVLLASYHVEADAMTDLRLGKGAIVV